MTTLYNGTTIGPLASPGHCATFKLGEDVDGVEYCAHCGWCRAVHYSGHAVTLLEERPAKGRWGDVLDEMGPVSEKQWRHLMLGSWDVERPMIRIQITADARKAGKTWTAIKLLREYPKSVLVSMLPISVLTRLYNLTEEESRRVWPVGLTVTAETWEKFDAWNRGRDTTHVIMDLN